MYTAVYIFQKISRLRKKIKGQHKRGKKKKISQFQNVGNCLGQIIQFLSMTWKNKSEEGVTEEKRQSQQRNLDADSNYKDLRPLEKSQYGLGR